MTSTDFIVLCKECEQMLRMAAPYKTGNLRYNAIKLEIMTTNEVKLYVDENIAPYMKYTNEPWKRGKNPNEGWFDRAAERIANYMTTRLQGTVKK